MNEDTLDFILAGISVVCGLAAGVIGIRMLHAEIRRRITK